MKRESREQKRRELASALWQEKIDSISVYNGRSYFKTVVAFIRSSLVYRAWIKFLSLFRRFRLLTYIAAFISYALALVGTGALLLVYLSVAAVALILSALILSVFLIIAIDDMKRSNAYLTDKLCEKDVYIFFSSSAGAISQSSFFGRNALDISTCDNACILLITPSLFSRRGLYRDHFFLTLKKECDNIYIIRKYYYFSFKKRVLPKLSGRVTMIF